MTAPSRKQKLETQLGRARENLYTLEAEAAELRRAYLADGRVLDERTHQALDALSARVVHAREAYRLAERELVEGSR